MWEFPQITSETLADQRVKEELAKRSGGERKISFPISLSWVNVLDVFTNFKLQDPYAINWEGAGDPGSYYYVESIGYDFIKEKLMIDAVDLMWLLTQFCVLGDENALPPNWLDPAGDPIDSHDRIYCYLADEITGEFADEEAGKMLISGQ
jgi:hypothetical protein